MSVSNCFNRSTVNSILNLSSDDKQPNEDNRDVTFDLNINDYSVSGVGLSSYDIVYGLENINNNNNVAILDDGSTSYPVTLTNGYYNYAELATEIQTQLNTLGLGAFVVTVDNNIYSIACPVPVRFNVNESTQYFYDWASMLDLPKDNILRSTIFGGVADIVYTNKLIIICDELHNSKTIGDYTSNKNNGNILGVIYLNENLSMSETNIDNLIKPHHASHEYSNIKWINKRINMNIYKLRIRILDGRGLPIPLASDGSGSVRWDLQIRLSGNIDAAINY